MQVVVLWMTLIISWPIRDQDSLLIFRIAPNSNNTSLGSSEGHLWQARLMTWHAADQNVLANQRPGRQSWISIRNKKKQHFSRNISVKSCVLERSKQTYLLANHTTGQTSWKSKAKSNNISAENLDWYIWQIQRRQLQ